MGDKSKCVGCVDDFYNGNNPLGVEECWCLKTAKVVSRVRVHIDQRPPWTQKPVKVYDCRREKGYVFVDPSNSGCRP